MKKKCFKVFNVVNSNIDGKVNKPIFNYGLSGKVYSYGLKEEYSENYFLLTVPS